MSDKETSLKEKLKRALTSTIRVISDDLEIKQTSKNNKNSNKLDFFELSNLDSKSDFIRARAEADSALKVFSDKIYKKNLPNNSNCKSLYAIAERLDETLGGYMLKGIEKTLRTIMDRSSVLKKGISLKLKKMCQ